MLKKVDPRQNFPQMENEVLEFWKKEKIFEESMADGGRPTFSFYDGPPFATGLPHYGHVVASLIKDVVPRYWTMRGNCVDRRWGWDCHGLPVENLIEKELGIGNKQAIEEMGIDKFNEACCGSVQRYAKEWKEFIPRVGRWVDMENDYRTMDWKYTESIWWVFSEVYKKGLVYEGYKAMHMCPRCETTLANFEVTQGYKDITDLSATVKFKLTKESAAVILNGAERNEESRSIQEKAGSFADAQDDSNVYVLAWTTTPWTLPGNVALAVGKDIDYTLVEIRKEDTLEYVLLATDTINKAFGNEIFVKDNRVIGNITVSSPEEGVKTEYKNAGRFKGEDLIGLSYEPLFDYYAKKEDLANRENGWKIYAADFVTTEEGVGVVHIAPAFGEDDMRLGHEMKLPFVQHVNRSGRFVDFISELAEEDKQHFVDKDGQGREVKPRRNPRETDEKVVEYLKEKGDLFASENYKHSYPHCWRCDTPLLNYASGSWFVEVTKIKDRLVANNQQVNWVPGYIKDGRFGKWLENAIDWAVSRSRFWGAPLPIWKCEECHEMQVIGSIDELREKSEQKITKLIFARHGFSENGIQGIFSADEDIFPLTDEGKKQAEELAGRLKGEKIDVIIASPILRTRETAEIVAKVLGLSVEKDERIREINFGSWDGAVVSELREKDETFKEYGKLENADEKYSFRFGGSGESRNDVEKRVREFAAECAKKYAGKTILVVGHQVTGAMLDKVLYGTDASGYFTLENSLQNARERTMYATEEGKGFDMHKPYIDRIELKCPKCGKPMKIVGDVFDCWFESGSMPYAQLHYPFENKEKFEQSFPADFIAEGIDQTRGWFYTLMVLATALFDKPAFKNVIVNGIVLAEDGQKMSKKLKNYPDPNLILGKYGADSLRYYLLTSPVMKAENLRFSEKGVDEVLKKFVLTLWNTYSFLVMSVELNKIKPEDMTVRQASDNMLDKWILSELDVLVAEVNAGMESYDLVKATRPLKDFVDNLSNWYLRRSRKRFSSEDQQDKLWAYQTLYYVLVTFTEAMAPFMPFLAEEIYRNLTDGKSVHLEKFPVADVGNVDEDLRSQMDTVREVVTLGLAVRVQNRIKVRMPLRTLLVQKEGLETLDARLIDILKDELNVKEVEVVKEMPEDKMWGDGLGSGIRVALDLTITEELELEGLSREVIRQIQAMRKIAGYERDERVNARYELSEDAVKFKKMFERFSQEITAECLLASLQEEREVIQEEFDAMDELESGGEKIILIVKR